MSSIALGATIVDALIGVGVTDVVLAPGSRSAALALAVDRAARAGSLRLHVRVDERVAGFTALGIAKASRRAVAVVTTSGTATANLGPAAMEATAAGVPLLLITADRPAHLVGSGANQTGDQAGILGPSALAVLRIGSESGDDNDWAAVVQRGVVLAEGRRTRRAGAVQVNVEFAPPLVGELPPARPRPLRVAGSAGHTTVDLDARRTVVLVGDATPEEGAEARALAELGGAPLLAEPSSNARVGANAVPDYRLRLGALGGDIERVVVFGHPSLSRPVTALLSRDDIELVVVSPGATWVDPGHRAAVVADRVLLEDQDPEWLPRWFEALPEAAPPTGRDLVTATVLESLGPDDDLVLGASSIIRAADLAPIRERAPRVFANRGLAGIDGTVATATGLALATGHPTTVLLGDLTAQHDLGALVRPPSEPWPERLRVVVVDDRGGSIFRGLEQGAPEYADSFDRVFLTPQGVDLVAVAAALGWRAARVAADALADALASDADFIVVDLS
ncbi:2-succinyl-5-enolpyruvyl-6-hydroxy-3-cyclohexene-1-carboxylic-acid synthase [Tessaracoccus lacteus]|uniref:2-succinyl-5-enolpyruvyl-6-hydroxy-3-cyclohexene-1-carboxylate synthase n=1 Tax=Tessaracoccus lacteus TaxID=3041766 RepID=A0ABY8PZ83_9ACTN|nr:2-succinyl-5-enolpyruvyl-6-hydroxy-3-cyclohexene-1-carboxylic-acid synthase [Tessaracoccus sp. T21]WGT47826.1 2-succinyl-5-enolpyruvyl-6-hydroxy-3-cyclohexene-1-carboxylic-acid synthase [Tessaracoccus sp. T21]